MHLIITWLVLSLAVWVTSLVVPGFKVRGFGGALAVAAIFGVLNWLIGWLLFVVIGLGTLGLGFLLAFLTRWIVNAILLEITDALSDKLEIRSFGWALIAALVMSLVGTVGEAAVNMARPGHTRGAQHEVHI
jgi:putative membrane protein